MSIAAHCELLRFVLTKTEDPEVIERQKLIASGYYEMPPEVKAEAKAAMKTEGKDDAVREGRVTEAHSMLRRVLARRKLALSPEDEARINACTDLSTLEQWVDRALEVNTASDALQ